SCCAGGDSSAAPVDDSKQRALRRASDRDIPLRIDRQFLARPYDSDGRAALGHAVGGAQNAVQTEPALECLNRVQTGDVAADRRVAQRSQVDGRWIDETQRGAI